MATQQDAIELNLPWTIDVPLTRSADGTLRVSGTRVPLGRIVACYRQGATPEEIHQRFSTVSAADAYAVISFYLRHQDVVDAFLAQREREAEKFHRQVGTEAGSRELYERLLARLPEKGIGAKAAE